jgi:hypothetical protein
MARGIWAMLTRGESYRGPVLIGALHWPPFRPDTWA